MESEGEDMTRLLSYHTERGLYWFRIFGWGIHIRNVGHHRLGFMEREGYYPEMWTFRVLRGRRRR
jgi:hypothetical protein